MSSMEPERVDLPRRFPFAPWGGGLIALGVVVGGSFYWVGMQRAFANLDSGDETGRLGQNINLVLTGSLIGSSVTLVGFVFLVVALVRRLRRA